MPLAFRVYSNTGGYGGAIIQMDNDAVSVKFQFTLPDGLALALKQAALREKLPLAQFIRETMEIRLRHARSGSGGDPFASIANPVDASDTGLAARVDEILYK
jgi:hypothetical protein